MWWRFRHNPTGYDDDWEDQPGQGRFYKWGLGIVLPLALMGYGSYAIAVQQVTFGGRISTTLRGLNATAFGIAWVSAGIFVHLPLLLGQHLQSGVVRGAG